MTWQFVVFIFISSCLALSLLSSRLIRSLINIAKYMRWREFIIAFFVIAFAGSLPNLLVDFGAALQGKTQIALGDVIGGNLVDLTLVLAIAVFFSKKGISAESEMVQKSAIFTAGISILPLLLILDGNLDRADGVILISAFVFYVWWIFSEKSRFKKYYRISEKNRE